jgi:tRNA(Ile)-lysidine synthase
VVENLIIRPLIRLERPEIEKYLKEKGIQFRTDESNLDSAFLRNKIRMELLPYVQDNFEPAVVSRIGRLVSLIQEEEALLKSITEEKAEKMIFQKDTKLMLDYKAISSFPRGLARRVIRDFVLRIKGDLRDISFEDVESILGLDEGKAFQLKKDLVFLRENDLVFLKEESVPEIKYEYLWDCKIPLDIKEINLNLASEIIPSSAKPDVKFDDNTGAFLDRDKLIFPLVVRNRRKGDRYQPLGSSGRNKLKEIMRAKAIPLRERDKRPVFLSGDEIIWVLGLPVSEKYKLTSKTRTVLRVTVWPV